MFDSEYDSMSCLQNVWWNPKLCIWISGYCHYDIESLPLEHGLKVFGSLLVMAPTPVSSMRTVLLSLTDGGLELSLYMAKLILARSSLVIPGLLYCPLVYMVSSNIVRRSFRC